jgi:hypothetical protein
LDYQPAGEDLENVTEILAWFAGFTIILRFFIKETPCRAGAGPTREKTIRMPASGEPWLSRMTSARGTFPHDALRIAERLCREGKSAGDGKASSLVRGSRASPLHNPGWE